MSTISISKDTKTVKGEKLGYLTGILFLAPSNESSVMNTCPFASKGCRKACLFTAGRGTLNNVRNSRIAKTIRFHKNREMFMSELVCDIGRLIFKASAKGLTPVVRLNGTSDINWHNIPAAGKANIMDVFPNIQFYDYTADMRKAIAWARGELPANYHITFSRKENNHKACEDVAAAGGNVTVVFATSDFPETYLGRKVVNGDESDLRFLDGKGVVVGLKAKGLAKKDTTGFVVQNMKGTEL